MPYKLSPKQRKAAQLMAEGELDVDIEKRLKMRFGTLNRWRRIPDFYQEMQRHAHNLEEVVPRRMQAMRTLSIGAACAELGYQPDAKILQQVHRVIEYTHKLTRLEIDALKSEDKTMQNIVHATQQKMIPELFEDITDISEKVGIDLPPPEPRRNLPKPSEN